MNHSLSLLVKELQADTAKILSLLKENEIELAEELINHHLILSEKIKKIVDKNPASKAGVEHALLEINNGTISIIEYIELSKELVAEKLIKINKTGKAVDLYRATIGNK